MNANKNSFNSFNHATSVCHVGVTPERRYKSAARLEPARTLGVASYRTKRRSITLDANNVEKLRGSAEKRALGQIAGGLNGKQPGRMPRLLKTRTL